jgi:hypothetical protein
MKLSVEGLYLGSSQIKEVGQNNSKTRSFWLDISDNQYSNTPEFQLFGDRVTLTEKLNPGDKIEVYFNLKGSKYTNSTTNKEAVFTNLQAWKIDKIVKESAATISTPATAPATEEDDLPF